MLIAIYIINYTYFVIYKSIIKKKIDLAIVISNLKMVVRKNLFWE